MLSKFAKNRWLWTALVIVAVFFVGFWLGARKPAEVRMVEDTVTKQKLEQSIQTERELRQQLSMAEKTITDLKVHKTEKVRIIYKNDGTKIVDKTTTTDIDKKTDTDKKVEVKTEIVEKIVEKKVVETEVRIHKETVTLPKDDFFLAASATVSLTGVDRPGIELNYRLIDLGDMSFWAGTQVVSGPKLNLSQTELRVSLGVSF